jgi:hypothetical protein
MSDIASELPVRSQLPGQVLPDDIIVKIGDGTNPTTQFLGIDSAGLIGSKLFDGAGNAVTSQVNGAQRALDVGIDVGGVQIDPRQIRALTAADVVTANQGSASSAAGGWFVRPTDGTNSQAYTAAGEAKVTVTEPLPAGTNVIGAVTQSGGPWTQNLTQVGGSAISLGQKTMANSLPVVISSDQSAIPVSQNGTWTVGLSEDHNWGTVGATTLRVAAEIGNATGSADFNYGTVGAQTVRVASQIGNATGAADYNNGATGAQTLRVAANLAVAGANVSATNPVPVSFSSAPLGTPVNNYNTASAIAAGASSNHIYTITALKTFQGKKIWAAASGLMKIEVRISPDGSTYSSIWVGFNSTANPNITIDMDEMVFLESGTGSTIEIIRTNLDKKAMDLYSTISGTEV